MKLTPLFICVGATTFLVRVLAALVMEWMSPAPHALKIYLKRLHPSRKRGELIVMNIGTLNGQFLKRTGHRVALVLVVCAGLIVPLRGQQTVSGPQGMASADVEAFSKNQQVPQEVLLELDAMKKRIEQLEAQLKQRDGAVGSTVADSASITAPATVSSSMPAPALRDEVVTTQESAPPAKPQPAEPFAFADWTWLNGNPRTKEAAFDSKFFTPEIRADVEYTYDFNHPKDDTIGGSSEIFRSNEIGLTQLGVGGDFHFDHVRARLMTQFGMYSETTPRNDSSYSRGQWNLADAYRYVSEAYGGYHWDALHGVNVDAGIFMSYVGLFSYYNFDNWAYQPSYVSSNTPWFFTGMRIQVFPTEKLKIEPWIINGWQSYGRFNGRLGLGGQVLYRPTAWFSVLSNNYGVGADALGIPNRTRYHTDNSIEVKYYDHPERFLDKLAFSVTADAGCESGGGVDCTTNKKNGSGQIVAYKQSFLGFMVYNRSWFHHDRYAVTIGGGKINNPGRYLVLLPPIDGATATSGTPYFTENPGDSFKAWDISGTYDYMPSQYITFRWEFNHRHANVPYWSGPGGITPAGGNNGNPGATIPGFQPDLRQTEDRATMAILVKF
ncbi:MAG TPA: outer membrane beta-barrel protein [Candidatus Dormibacteraeota bacterium]|nr:outer membrane beta-barrel protein [Candidatus Dormibacteraeota bacterium]